MYSESIRADHDLIFRDFGSLPSVSGFRFSDLGGYLNRTRDRWWVVWQSEALLAEPPTCSCDSLPDLITVQVIRRMYESHVHDTEAFYEVCFAMEANAREWETLRGGYGRRASLEVEIGLQKRRLGRPRRVFLVEEDRETIVRVLDHVRIASWDHVKMTLHERFAAQFSGDVDDIRRAWAPWPALADPRIRKAMSVFEEATVLTPAQYNRRRSMLVARVLAAVGNCSSETTRRPLPQSLKRVRGKAERARAEKALATLARVAKAEQERDKVATDDVNVSAVERVADVSNQTPEQIEERLQKAWKPSQKRWPYM